LEPIIRKVQPYEPHVVFEMIWFNRIAGFIFGIITCAFLIFTLIFR